MNKINLHKPGSILSLIILIVLFKGLCYITQIPPWLSPDETSHFRYVRELATADLGVKNEVIGSMEKFHFFDMTPNVPIGESVKGAGPPLYHIIAAVLIKIFHISNFDSQFYFCRLLSLLFGIGVIIVTFFTAKEVFPERPILWLYSSLLVSLIPQFNIVSSSIGYESLDDLFGSLCVLGVILITKYGLNTHLLIFETTAIVLGAITKRISILFFIVLFILPLLVLKTKHRLTSSQLIFFYGLMFIGSAVIFLLIKLFLPLSFNYSVFTFLSTVKAVINSIFTQNILLPKTGWFKFHEHLFNSFWGVFGWLRFPLYGAWYYLIFIFVILSIYGLNLAFMQQRHNPSFPKMQLFVLLGALLLAYFGVYFYEGLKVKELPQGRYLFIALTPIVILLTYGLSQVNLLKSYGGILPWAMGFLLLLDIVCFIQYIFPAFHFFYANIQGNIFI